MMWDWAPWWHWLMMAGVWVVVFGLIVWAVASVAPTRPHDGDAERILDERLARGELGVEEYRRLRQELDPDPRAAERARA